MPAKKTARKKAGNVEVIRRTIPPAREAEPERLATLTADEMLEHKIRTVMVTTARDAYVLWVRAIKAKYKIDQQSVLEIDPATGQLRLRKTVTEGVTVNG